MLNQTKLQFLRPFLSGLLAATTLIAVAPAARATDVGATETTSFAALDVNQDGFIDKKEASILPSLMKVFDALDVDKDGRLSPAEYAKASSLKPS